MVSIDYGSEKDIDRWMRIVQKVSGSFPARPCFRSGIRIGRFRNARG